MNRKVYVTNLAPETGQPDLKSLFSKAGDAMSIRIVKDMYPKFWTLVIVQEW